MRSKSFIVIFMAIAMAMLSGFLIEHKSWAVEYTTPQVDTESAVKVTPTSATLKGSYRPHGINIKETYFEYGTTTNYGTTVHPKKQCTAYDWDTICDAFAPIDNLMPQQTYHFRYVVKYWHESSHSWRLMGGGDSTFSTHVPPKAVTGDVTDVTSTSAVLHGTAYPNGNNTDAYFDYHEYCVMCSPGGTHVGRNIGSGNGPVPLDIKITGLKPGTHYSYYLSAKSPAGTSKGGSNDFFTPDKPVVTTLDATEVGTHGATLNGSVNPSSLDTMYYFEYGPTASYGIKKSPAYAGKGHSAKSVSMELPKSFNPGQVYHFRIVATNNLGVSYGQDKTFKAETVVPPTATTGNVTDITISHATLNGVVNPHNDQTMWHFEYRKPGTAWKKTDNCGTSVEKDWPISAKIFSLDPGTTYSYKLVATNGAGTTTGVEKTFKTASLALPTATTGPANNVTKSSATVTGSINPNDTPTSYWFWYGTSTQYTTHTTGQTGLTGKNAIPVSAALSGLAPNTTYYYRITANNIQGSIQGQDKSFKTENLYNPPVVSTGAARNITSSTAEINGTVNPNGQSTTYYFEYGPTTAYGSKTPAAPKSAGSSTSPVPVSVSLSGLRANATYQYRLVAVNSAGAGHGTNMVFQTPASTPALKPNLSKPDQTKPVQPGLRRK